MWKGGEVAHCSGVRGGGRSARHSKLSGSKGLSQGLGGTEPLPLPQELSLKPVRCQSKVPPAIYGAHINLLALGEKGAAGSGQQHVLKGSGHFNQRLQSLSGPIKHAAPIRGFI